MIESVLEPEVVFPPSTLSTPSVAPVPRLTFDDLVQRYQTEIYRYAMQLTRNRADADDLYQETLIKAYRAFDRLDAGANYRAWLYRIATNTFLTSLRRVNREAPLDDAVEAAIPDEAEDRAASLDARDLLREVSAFVNLLPAKQRIALILRKYQGLGYREIAANLETSEGAARANVHEAMRKLRDQFYDRF